MNLIDKIDNHLISKNTREKTSYYPSEVSKCRRAMFYRWNKVEESNPVSAGGFWKMKMGSKLHDLFYDFLKDTGLEIVPEVSFKKEIEGLNYPISGRIDNLFIDEDSILAGIECKTTYGAGIRALKDKGPKEQDIEQVIIYMECTDIRRFYMLYVGRDDGYRCQFIIEKTDGVIRVEGKPVHVTFEELIDKFRYVEKCRIENTVPGRDFKVAIKNGEIKSKFQKDKVEYKTDWQCSYCQWKDYCWKDELDLYKDSDNSGTF